MTVASKEKKGIRPISVCGTERGAMATFHINGINYNNFPDETQEFYKHREKIPLCLEKVGREP